MCLFADEKGHVSDEVTSILNANLYCFKEVGEHKTNGRELALLGVTDNGASNSASTAHATVTLKTESCGPSSRRHQPLAEEVRAK